MSWNHRVLKQSTTFSDGSKEVLYAIGEVYYDENDKPCGYTDRPALVGDTPEELAEVLELMKKALFKKVIEVDENDDSMKEIV